MTHPLTNPSSTVRFRRRAGASDRLDSRTAAVWTQRGPPQFPQSGELAAGPLASRVSRENGAAPLGTCLRRKHGQKPFAESVLQTRRKGCLPLFPWLSPWSTRAAARTNSAGRKGRGLPGGQERTATKPTPRYRAGECPICRLPPRAAPGTPLHDNRLVLRHRLPCRANGRPQAVPSSSTKASGKSTGLSLFAKNGPHTTEN